MTSLYRNESSDPKRNAQKNLAGRTHYVDDDTLRFHKSRILSARHVDKGLLFAIVESVAIDYRNTHRGCRFVVFDLFGNVVSRVPLEECWSTSAKAEKAMWAFLNTVDAQKLTHEAIEQAERYHRDEMTRLRTALFALSQDAAA